MTSDVDSEFESEIKDLKHTLRTADLELSLERSKHSVEIVAKDEEVRKLRVAQCLLQDQSSELREQLEEEQERSDALETALDGALMQLDEQAAVAEMAQNQIRTQSREVANLKAELKAMENVTSDSNKILSEKLSLNRELSSLRPEVEHLRAQVESNQGLLSEKLSLQRQLNTAQVELENEKRMAARAIAKQEKKMEQDEELRTEMEELRKELAKERKDRLKVEATLAKTEKAVEKTQADLEAQQQATERVQAKLEKAAKKEAAAASKHSEEQDAALEKLGDELANEKAARIAAEKANKKSGNSDAELDRLRTELETERQRRQQLSKTMKKSSQEDGSVSDDLKKELEEEKRERKQQEKEFSKTLAELQGRNTVLDDKLNAFREKLRSTKEKLKEKEAELEKMERAQTVPPIRTTRETSVKPAKNARKRVAASVEPETNLGTPGNGFPAKKTKHIASSSVGDTSTFSLTPFLNRTSSVAPGETIIEEEDENMEAGAQEATPTAPPKKAPKKAVEPKKALAPSASNKANAKPRKKATATALEMVTEEVSDISSSKDNSENAPVTVPLKSADDGDAPKDKSLKPKVKPRKSLMSFATFTEEPAAEKKKKRKLGASSTNGGGLGKTLFDAEEEDAAPAKATSSKGIFAARAIGKSMLGKGRAQQGPISGGYNMMSEEGFSFSPLKKDRRSVSILK
ncbi:unnamed protein product [Periconia digitata]|uniref:Uncharacterized protein n=1 Tax=Periconia digitata TaxID=1303443 RepID=A0A9W4UH90_9PLEO|nr:unnamed protein product [Periconia digitata]